MKYRKNLWDIVEKIQCSPDQKNIQDTGRREVFNEKSPRLERELKNAVRL